MKLPALRTKDAHTSDELRARASENRSLVAWLMGFWLVALIGFALWLKITYELRGDLNCPVPGMDSTYGKSSWQWFPPGEVCAYPGTGIPTAQDPWVLGLAWLILVLVLCVASLIWWRISARRATPYCARTGSALLDLGVDACRPMILEVMHSHPGVKAVVTVPGMTRVEVRTGMGVRSWGEDIEVSAEATATEQTLVTVVSAARVNSVVVDWGKNRHNVNAILGQLIDRAGGERIAPGTRATRETRATG